MNYGKLFVPKAIAPLNRPRGKSKTITRRCNNEPARHSTKTCDGPGTPSPRHSTKKRKSPTPRESPSASAPCSAVLSASFDAEYNSIPDSALLDLVHSDDDNNVSDLGATAPSRASIASPLVSPSAKITPSPPHVPHVSHVSHDSPGFHQSLVDDLDVSDDGVPSPIDNSHTPSARASASARGPRPITPSFPNSPPPRIRPITSNDSNPSPSHTYTDQQYVPEDRDYAMDYEAVMTTITDFNSMSNFIFRGGARRVRRSGMYVQYTREDVIPILEELKTMIDRLFRRLNG